MSNDESDLVNEVSLDFSGSEFLTDEPKGSAKWEQVKVRIAEGKAKNRNFIAATLVLAFVASFPIYAVFLVCSATEDASVQPHLTAGFNQWLAVVGSLAGAAVGVKAFGNASN